MTRSEYLKELKLELRILPAEEQEEALEYYRGFFEDADDDSKVMEDLGSPKELASTIIEKFASVPEIKRKNTNNESEGSYGNFAKDEVRSIDISVGTAEVVLAGTGNTFCVEYRGLEPGSINCSLSPFGTFCVENSRQFPDLSKIFKKRDDGGANHPRILIKIPAETKLDLVRIHVGAGSFVTKDIKISTARSYLDVGAGNLDIEEIYGGAAEIHVGMGHLSYKGSVTGLVKADCGMGQIEMKLKGCQSDYSVEGKVGLGSIKLNKIKKDGFGTLDCMERKDNHFLLNCGLGEIKIKIKEEE